MSQATRLDRLLILLETGSAAATRKAAAEQIGDLAKGAGLAAQNSILYRARLLLRSKSWDTRVAAAAAVEAVCRSMEAWAPRVDGAAGEIKTEEEGGGSIAPGVLDTFDVETIIAKGQLLVSSSGAEFNDIDMDPQERLALQKQQLRETLGLAPAKGAGDGKKPSSSMPTHKGDLFNVGDMIDDKDLVGGSGQNEEEERKRKLKRKASDLVDSMAPQVEGGGAGEAAGGKELSARERNQLRRKQRKMKQDAAFAPPPPPVAAAPGGGNSEGGGGDVTVTEQPQDDKRRVVVESVKAAVVPEAGEGVWPLEPFCEAMCHDIFDAQWEIRHGGCMALRDALKHHAAGAGRISGDSQQQQDDANGDWLEECVVRLLCVLALDRFGDYVSDQVVAPVRETSSQALGVVLRTVSERCLPPVIACLTKLAGHEWWEVRHGGMLGFKYLIAVRPESAISCMGDIMTVIKRGIQDEDDDVRAVAAEALLPLVKTVVADAESARCHGSPMLTLLWEALLELDDLTASTTSVMTLIAEFLERMPNMECMHDGTDLACYVRRLWPFFRHNSYKVRHAVLRIITAAISAAASSSPWLRGVLGDALHLVFINLMLETRQDIADESMKVWDSLVAGAQPEDLPGAVNTHIKKWFAALGTPPGAQIADECLSGVEGAVKASNRGKQADAGKGKRGKGKGGEVEVEQYLTVVDEFGATVRMRVAGVRALGVVAHRYVASGGPELEFFRHVDACLASKFGTQVHVGAMVLCEWAKASRAGLKPGDDIVGLQLPASTEALLDGHIATLGQEVGAGYGESGTLEAKWREELAELMRLYDKAGDKVGRKARKECDPSKVTSMEALRMAAETSVSWEVGATDGGKGKGLDGKVADRELARRRLITTVAQLGDIQKGLHTSILVAVASVYVETRRMPQKVAPMIRAIMEGVQHEGHELLQSRAADAIVGLMRACEGRKVSPAPKIVNNLAVYLCEDPSFTPRAVDLNSTPEAVSLEELTYEPASDASLLAADDGDGSQRILRLKKRGAAMALQAAARTYGPSSFSEGGALKPLWDKIAGAITSASTPGVGCLLGVPPVQPGGDAEYARAQEVVDMIQVMSTLAPCLEGDARSASLSLLPHVISLCSSRFGAVRQVACRFTAQLCTTCGTPAMEAVIRSIPSMLGDTADVYKRMGAVECLHRVVHRMGLSIVPFSIFLVVPILGRMSDQNTAVRQCATQCFGTLLQLLPLEAGIPDPEGLSKDLASQKVDERRFLEQLLDTSKVDNYVIPVKIDATLRRYQQEGVNWMAFLMKYQLHGVLADDMGLGKTLQTICIIASDHHDRRTANASAPSGANAPIPSLVVCPPTLVGHWGHEIEKFTSGRLGCVLYYGSPAERRGLRAGIKGTDKVVVTSYETVRSDADFLGSLDWDYCVLDEGHVIKNPKSGISKAVKSIKANHRLLLSGTPIQNNVLELWSLFDFLMPGFLGTEQHFAAAYSKPILASRGAKCTPAQAEAGALALEALHRQVLPFMLRRTKTEVLSDLPPKIIQDHYCDLSDVQVALYNDYVSRQSDGIKTSVQGAASGGGGGGEAGQSAPASSHIFQALQYLRKLANHPKLVFDAGSANHGKIAEELRRSGRTIDDVELAPKLLAVRQLLWDCGIGGRGDSKESGEESVGGGEGGRHRVLIFAQMKVMLDIIENDLFRKQMPSVSFMRMDGATPNKRRFEIQQEFNGDPTIDVLMLTTHVGGLGLNLTGADTVIFVEHDWNPMRDLQAMDRAHRIGQKSVVNVYRLITRDTLEEKIMGLQRFKLNIANSVVNEDNASLKNMDTAQLLDLFTPLEPGKAAPKGEKSAEGEADAAGGKGGGKLAEVLAGLEELWDEEQYKEEFNVEGFVASLAK